MHVKTETTNNMLMPFQKNVAQNHNTGRDITSFDYVAKFEYFRNQNCFAQTKEGQIKFVDCFVPFGCKSCVSICHLNTLLTYSMEQGPS